MTSQGNPATVFRRAIEHGNLVSAELNARLMGGLSLAESLELTALMAQKDHPHARRAAARWLRLYLDTPGVLIGDAAYVAGALCALGGPSHALALTSLRDMLARASSGAEPTAVRFGESGERGGSV